MCITLKKTFYTGGCHFCTKGHFCTGWHFCTRTLLHGDSFARRVTFARGETFARRLFCMKGHFCTMEHFGTATFLHEGSLLHKGTLLHGDSFARRVTFARVDTFAYLSTVWLFRTKFKTKQNNNISWNLLLICTNKFTLQNCLWISKNVRKILYIILTNVVFWLQKNKIFD